MKVKVLLYFLFFSYFLVYSQEDKKTRFAIVAFYNLENLFDTINDPLTNDEEFLPDGANKWTGQRYREKLNNMAFVIDKIGNAYANARPTILGVCEVENRYVLEDLVKTDLLKKQNYGIVHYNSPDKRGVDVALLYNTKRFKVLNSKSYILTIPDKPDFATRNQLYVSGLLDGDTLHLIVLHWPSRRGGKASEASRIEAAKLTRKIVDSVFSVQPNAQIIVMGDLNDDPNNESIYKYLNAKGNRNKLKPDELYNPFYEPFKNGIGSLSHQGKWNLFDQLIVSQSFINSKGKWKLKNAHVFNESFLIQQEGKYAGSPFRTFAGGSYIGGYSDHFPSYIVITKE